jgi:negative regulator of flagellin synthesis FlgM
MKVNTNSPQNSSAVDTTQKATEKSKVGSKGIADNENVALGQAAGSTVEISDTARLLQKATDLVKQTPDVRQDRIQALKKSIADGTYRVDSPSLADRILEEHLGSHFGKNSI